MGPPSIFTQNRIEIQCSPFALVKTSISFDLSRRRRTKFGLPLRHESSGKARQRTGVARQELRRGGKAVAQRAWLVVAKASSAAMPLPRGVLCYIQICFSAVEVIADRPGNVFTHMLT